MDDTSCPFQLNGHEMPKVYGQVMSQVSQSRRAFDIPTETLRLQQGWLELEPWDMAAKFFLTFQGAQKCLNLDMTTVVQSLHHRTEEKNKAQRVLK